MDAAQTSASAVEQEDSLLAVAAAHSLALIAVNNPEPDPTEYATTVEALDVALQQLEGVKLAGLLEVGDESLHVYGRHEPWRWSE